MAGMGACWWVSSRCLMIPMLTSAVPGSRKPHCQRQARPQTKFPFKHDFIFAIMICQSMIKGA